MNDMLYVVSKAKQEPKGIARSSGIAEPSKGIIDKILNMIKTTDADLSGHEGHTREDFMADLKKASSKVKPGHGLSREDGIKRIVETYPDTLRSLKD